MNKATRKRYRATITAGSLKVPESRIIADLLIRGVDKESWKKELYDQNLLQARTSKTIDDLVKLIRARLILMKSPLWKLIRDGSSIVSTHACFAAAVKHSALLGDFLDIVIREQYRVYIQALSNTMWTKYIEDCQGRDPEMPQWSESTVARLRSSVYQILAQAGYIENTRSLKLYTVHFAKEVLQYLEDQEEEYVLRCIQVAP